MACRTTRSSRRASRTCTATSCSTHRCSTRRASSASTGWRRSAGSPPGSRSAPSWRPPGLLGVLALTMGLATIGVMQLRREDELARMRADFIAGVSHELRTPLAQVRMFAETLMLGRVRSEGEQRRSLEIIDQEARRLTHLVENILQFSRAERRAVRLAPVPVELSSQLREAAEAFSPVARARRATVCTALEHGIMVVADPGALRQIVLNLLDNAVKYGPPGQTVTLGLRRDGERARIWVD